MLTRCLTKRILALFTVVAIVGCGTTTEPDPDPPGNGNTDTVAPTVVSVTPSDQATDVDRSTTVVITFSENVSPATVTTSSITVSNTAGTVTVSGASATFTADAPLIASTQYTVTVATTVQDQAGNGLAAQFTASFTTVANNLPAADGGADQDVSLGSNVTLDASGSSDPDSDPLTYAWMQVSGPTVGTLTADAVQMITVPNTVSTLVFEVAVDDGTGSPATDQVVITVLESPNDALFVDAAAGDDANTGTRSAPFKTIQAALDAADNGGLGADVYVAGGTYAENVTLRTRVSMYGGFDGATWLRDDLTVLQTVVTGVPGTGSSIAFHGNSTNSLTVEGFDVSSADATDPGASSIGIFLFNSSSVRLLVNRFSAGMGAAGSNGGTGSSPATAGAKGSNGVVGGACPNNGGGGGDGRGSSDWDGGGGGGGGRTGGSNGGAGQGPDNGARGNGAGGAATGGAGGNASPTRASTGSHGAGGGAFGQLSTTTGYASSAANGGNGGTGENGSGGGGGGGGAGFIVNCGGGGGGGGGGGQGGGGGAGGQAGGASIAIVLGGATAAELTDNTVVTANGGDAGSGGGRGTGSARGAGGSGGAAVASVWGGGKGGNGSAGGFGGNGGGGGGGPVIGIMVDVTATLDLTGGNTIAIGTPGAGGTSTTNSGATGEAVNVKTIT